MLSLREHTCSEGIGRHRVTFDYDGDSSGLNLDRDNPRVLLKQAQLAMTMAMTT
jgi:hypothetical protein